MSELCAQDALIVDATNATSERKFSSFACEVFPEINSDRDHSPSVMILSIHKHYTEFSKGKIFSVYFYNQMCEYIYFKYLYIILTIAEVVCGCTFHFKCGLA